MRYIVSVPAVGVNAVVNETFAPLIAPAGVSRVTKFPEVSQADERAVNTSAVVPSVMASVTSFHPVSALTVPTLT